MMEGYLGEIKLWSGQLVPAGWEICGGQTLAISTNQPLFGLIGTMYGTAGKGTFKLPDLMGRVPVGVSSFPHLGEKFGDKTVRLAEKNLPTHNHGIKGSSPSSATANLKIYNGTSNTNSATGAKSLSSAGSYDSGHGITAIPMLSTSTPNATLNNVVIGITATLPTNTENTGEGEAFYNYQPSLGINYIICVKGIYPNSIL